jgi:hypothetical protein
LCAHTCSTRSGAGTRTDAKKHDAQNAVKGEKRPNTRAAVRKLLELAKCDRGRHSRLPIGVINMQFMAAGGSSAEYRAAVTTAIAHGWLILHTSGGYLKFTQAGADLFAQSEPKRNARQSFGVFISDVPVARRLL